jgi:serpin B
MASALALPSSGSPFDDQNALNQTLAGRAAAAYAYDQTRVQPPSSVSADNYTLDVVNSVWGQKGSPWSQAFLDTMATSYGTGIYTEDFASDPTTALTDINDWVSTQTSGKIDPLLAPSSIDSSTRIVLVNAVDLKMPWAKPFNAALTTTGPFTRGDGSQVTASLMHGRIEGDFGYTETSAATFVSLPLAGEQLWVVLTLPKTDLSSLVGSLTADAWASAWSALQQPPSSGTLSVTLPKLTFTTSGFSLTNALETLGMHQAFDPQTADFSALCSSCTGLYISDVVQKATIGIDEVGVEASAATAVLTASVAAENPIVATFDHPFLVSIVDQSGAILFLGQLNDPTDTGSP